MPQEDAYRFHAGGMDSPATRAAAITPSDGVDVAVVPRALYCLVSGTVRVTVRDSVAPVDLYMLAGVPLPLRVVRVWATGTTATGIVGVW